MNRPIDRDYDCYDFNDESDQEPCDSSDDDLDVILHGTPEQKRKLQNKVRQRSESSSEDDFEKEMNDELNNHIKQLEKQQSNNQPSGTSATTGIPSDTATDPSVLANQEKYYDDIYFDSDEEEMVLQGDERVKRKQEIVSNDDLLYDPNLDDEDQKWVDSQRQMYQPPNTQSGSKPSKLPSSDAVLNCPACMTLLCLDCQRHDKYENQYRAMFVKNCNVDTTELLKQPLKKKKKNQKTSSTTEEDPSDSFHPVKCTQCSTVVGVFDNDEVYHFFNILSSYT